MSEAGGSAARGTERGRRRFPSRRVSNPEATSPDAQARAARRNAERSRIGVDAGLSVRLAGGLVRLNAVVLIGVGPHVCFKAIAGE